MSSIFNDELAQARHKFLTNIGKITQLGVINNAASIAFNTHKGRKAYLEGYTTDEIKGYTLLFPELQAYIDKYRTREGFWRWSQSLPLKMKRLVHQYSVVFLVTIFEAFIGDVLLIVFKNRPECLSSEKIIT
ncbi:MAG: hypothetical protein H8D89_00755 [Dehalococcoidia bacterium]|nr:hypothetical protein [Dehalococcoidia bacterium]